jgi:hypothetical protein
VFVVLLSTPCADVVFARRNLDDTNLYGPLPTAWQQLRSLESLTLSRSRLQGSLPTWLGLMTNLQVLSLESVPELIGTIPTELGKLVHLTMLRLGSGKLNGTLPGAHTHTHTHTHTPSAHTLAHTHTYIRNIARRHVHMRLFVCFVSNTVLLAHL